MRIAFDLDGTLICGPVHFPIEPKPHPFIKKILSLESLRRGIIDLAGKLKEQKHEIWIYTSSHRSSTYIKWLFRLHGIRLDGVINQQIHDLEKKHWHDKYKHVSKMPSMFGIDLLIEDSVGVKIEGEKYGFSVLVIEGTDLNWTEKVLHELNKIS